MTDDDFTDEEVAFALRELERLGLVESRMGDDGRVYYRRTGKELTDEISDYNRWIRTALPLLRTH